MQILSTKLSFPPLRARLVNRGRLFQKLDQATDCGFVLISAPAGYGKSMLINAWLRQAGVSAAWLSLDERDNQPERFLGFLLEALRKVEPGLGKDLAISLQSSSLAEVDVVLTPLLNELEMLGRPLWVVLDDYHVIQNQTVHQVVRYLVEHCPAPFHLVIATRADPPFPLSRLRARSQIVELRLADLRFDKVETAEFMGQVMKLNLSEADLDFLETRTEGWIAGIQMAALSLQGRADAASFFRSFSGENRYILDFLFDEVFQRQPEVIQTFLLQTAVLERLCGELCDAVIQGQNSQAVLEILERSNLFLIPLDEQRRWYRYHHLFADLLKSRLKQTFPGEAARLHQRACAWYQAENDLENAIVHALAAQDFEAAASLIEKIFRTLDMHNQLAMLTAWLDRLPGEILGTHPWICVYRAYGFYWGGKRGKEEEWLRAAEKSLAAAWEEKDRERQHIQGHIATIRALVALTEENLPVTLEMGQKSLELLPEDDEMRCDSMIALGGAYWALGDVHQSERAFKMAQAAALKVNNTLAVPATCYSGVQQVKQGRLQDAMLTFRDALRLATLPDGNETPVAGCANVKLGQVYLEQDNLTLAAAYLQRAVEQCIRLGQPDFIAEAYARWGAFQLSAGNLAASWETLQKADQVTKQSKIDPFIGCLRDECRIKAWLQAGNLEAAGAWARDCGLMLDQPLNYLHDLDHRNLARVLVAQVRLAGSNEAHEKALSLLNRLQIAAEHAGWVHEEISILVMQVVNFQAVGKSELALQSLGRAAVLAQAGGYVRVFLDEGEILTGPLSTLETMLRKGLTPYLGKPGNRREQERIAPLADYVSNLLAAFNDRARQGGQGETIPSRRGIKSGGTVEVLSERELQVIRALAQGCSDKQIAENLVIARETVHKHLKNIYGKLNVHSRTEAIARARELDLV